MAKLAAFERDTVALSDGVWINPDPRNTDIELRVRAKDAAFVDVLSAAYRELVRKAREDGRLKSRQGLNDLPPSAVQAAEDDLILDRLVLDVRNLEGEAGAITIADYRRMARTEQFRPLLDLAREAVAIATERRAADREDAVGNSVPTPPTASSGAAQPA
jgi:hypothetical protein